MKRPTAAKLTSRESYSFREFLDKAMLFLNYLLAFLCALFICVWTYAPFRDWLIRKKFVADKADVTTDAVSVAIILILGVLSRLQGRMTSLLKQISSLLPQFDDIIDRGIAAIYPYLCDSIKEASNDRERTLEVLGLTLYTAWPHIRDWIQNEELRKWKIKLYCVNPGYMEKDPSNFPIQWLHHAQTQIEDISLYKDAHQDDLKAFGISIELYEYTNFPALHGFRLGSGEIFFSAIQWEPTSQKLTDPYMFYERVRTSDRSRRANLYRTMFDNWIKKAAYTSIGTISSGVAKINLPPESNSAPATFR